MSVKQKGSIAMKLFNLKRSWILVAAAFLILILSKCQKNSSGPDTDPPVLPPQAALLIDFSNFSAGGTMPSIPNTFAGETQLLSKNNWGWAATNVLVWSAIVKITLAVPVAAFSASFQNDPEFTDDGRWLWTNTFNILTVQYTSKLYAEVRLNKVEWEMYISKSNAYTDFLWYKGETDFEAREGEWLFYNNPENPTPLIEVTWHRTNTEVTDIKYLNVVPAAAENGSYIFYYLTDDVTYDAAFDLFSQVNNNHTLVEWNRVNKSGRVQDAIHFGDEQWHCWNESRDDIQCP